MKQIKRILSFIAIAMALAVCGCGSQLAPESSEMSQESPKEVYLSYISAIEKGDYAKAESFLAQSVKDQMLQAAAALGRAEDVVLKELKFNTDLGAYLEMDVSSIEEELEGTRAKVAFKGKAGSLAPFTGYYSLQKEDGMWKLEMMRITGSS